MRMKRSWIFMRPPLVDSSSELGKGLFDLMEKFLKFRIKGWPVYKASSLLVHCPLISGEECWCPKTTGDHQTQNTKPKLFSPPQHFLLMVAKSESGNVRCLKKERGNKKFPGGNCCSSENWILIWLFWHSPIVDCFKGDRALLGALYTMIQILWPRFHSWLQSQKYQPCYI